MGFSKLINFEISFSHGCGDCALFAPALKHWCDTTFFNDTFGRIIVECPNDDRQFFFKAIKGIEVRPSAPAHWSFAKNLSSRHHPYNQPSHSIYPKPGGDWLGNKLGFNLNQGSLRKPITPIKKLWEQYLAFRPSLLPFLNPHSKGVIDQWLRSLGKPLVILHTRGKYPFTLLDDAGTYFRPALVIPRQEMPCCEVSV